MVKVIIRFNNGSGSILDFKDEYEEIDIEFQSGENDEDSGQYKITGTDKNDDEVVLGYINREDCNYIMVGGIIEEKCQASEWKEYYKKESVD